MIYNESKFNTEWDTISLNDLGEFKRGKSKHRPRNDPHLFVDGKYPLVQTGEIKAANLYINSHQATYNDFGLKQSKMWNAGTLCITIAANIAETGILRYPMCFPDSVVGFVADREKTSEFFMHYVFAYIRKSIQNSALGSIQDNINIELLTALSFKIPKKTIQDKIVGLLAAIDSKIEVNKSINAELEAIAKTTYDYWFLQFDFPNEEGKPYKTSGGETKYNEELKREIPKAWEEGKLEDIIEVHDSKRIPLSNQEREKRDGPYPYYGATEIMDYVDEYIFDGTYVLMAEDGSVMDKNGYPILQYIWGKSWVNNHAHVLEGKGVSNEYLHLMLKNIPVINIMSGSIQKKINQENLNNTPIVRVPAGLVKTFDKTIHPLYSKLKLIIEESKELVRLRDFLLPLLMNGQVKVQ